MPELDTPTTEQVEKTPEQIAAEKAARAQAQRDADLTAKRQSTVIAPAFDTGKDAKSPKSAIAIAAMNVLRSFLQNEFKEVTFGKGTGTVEQLRYMAKWMNGEAEDLATEVAAAIRAHAAALPALLVSGVTMKGGHVTSIDVARDYMGLRFSKTEINAANRAACNWTEEELKA